MTARQALLVRYSAAALALTLVVVAGVMWVERVRDADTDTGIVDVLARELPANAPTNRFTDGTARAGIGLRHFPAVRSRVLPEDMGSGLAWGDCDGDGFDDLYVVNFVAPIGSSPDERAGVAGNALYRNRGDGTFEQIGAEAGVGLKDFGMGAAWGDYDADGDVDLYVTNYGGNALFRNDGFCGFAEVTEETGVGGGDDFSAGAVWVDYDGDDDLDLYVTNYVDFDESMQPRGGSVMMQYGRAVPFTLNPASYQPVANRLFRNDGGRFTDVAEAAGVANAAGRSLSAAWADWDADGDLDLYVANDISDNAFFMNLGDGTFEDISTLSLTADYRGAMGLAVGDYDRDADLDLFVTHWVAQENALYQNHMTGDREGERPLFTDVADLVGLGATGLDYVGWGTGFLDLDNDGWLDLFVANGHTIEDEADESRLLPHRMQLFWNRGEEGFFELSDVAGPPFERLLVARGAAASDYDRDGDVDIAVLVHGRGVLLLDNGGTPGNHWIEIDLNQEGGNPDGIGAFIRVDIGEQSQLVSVGGSASYLSQHSLTAHFGLGDAERIDRVVVRWPDGSEEAFAGLAVDTRHVLRRGSGSDPAAVSVASGSDEDFWAFYRAGNEARRAGDRAAAIADYERALAIQPAHLDTLHNLAQLRYARGEVREAWDLLERLASADPRGNRAWQQLSRVAGTPLPGWAVDLDTADEMIDRALEINPGNSESHLLKARWAAYRGDGELAATEVEAALGLNPRGAEAYALGIWLAVRGGDGAHAERLRQAAIRAMCGDEAQGRDCLGDALHGALSAYWGADGSPRPARSDVVGRVAADAMPLTAGVDLDGDGSPDLQVAAWRPLHPVHFAAAEGSGHPLGAAGPAWRRAPSSGRYAVAGSERGPGAIPWRGFFINDDYGRALLLAGGGNAPLRWYEPSGGVWRERAVSGLPRRLAGPVVAAADWDDDGGVDVFVGNAVGSFGTGPDVAGAIYWRRGVDRFAADEPLVTGALSAALALDVDGDGDADLVTARALPSRETAVAQLLDPGDEAVGEEPTPLLTLWRTADGVLQEVPGALPTIHALVQDLAAIVPAPGGSGAADLWLATGGLAPERIEGDVLLVNRNGRFVDESSALAEALRWGRTLRAWPHPAGGLTLVRGGIVPADPQMFLAIPPRPRGVSR